MVKCYKRVGEYSLAKFVDFVYYCTTPGTVAIFEPKIVIKYSYYIKNFMQMFANFAMLMDARMRTGQGGGELPLSAKGRGELPLMPSTQFWHFWQYLAIFPIFCHQTVLLRFFFHLL